MARAISVSELITKTRNVLPFDGEWRNLMGCPELAGSIIIWGGSSSGKTSFAVQFAKYLAQFEKVIYNSLEEGDSESLAITFVRANMNDVAGRVVILDKEPLNELMDRLGKHKSPNVVIIDSLQYTQITLPQYIELKKQFPKKLFVFISHADGKKPEGKIADKIKYDSNVKIFISGYQAYCNSRYGGGQPYVIWAEGAAKCWGVDHQNNVNENQYQDETNY